MMTWPMIAILIVILFVVDFATVRFYKSEKGDYIEEVTKITETSNYQEAVLRIKSLISTGEELATSAGINISYLPDGKVYMYKHVNEDENGNPLSGAEPDAFDKIFKDTTDADNLTNKLTAALNIALKGLKDTDINIFDSVLTAKLTENELYTPYKLELVNTDTPSLGKTLEKEGYHTPIISKFEHILSLDSDSKIYYRFTCSPFNLIFKELSGILILEILALIIIIFSAFYLVKLNSALRKTEMFREEFTHLVTHNMNNPITIALASTEALQKMECAQVDERKSMYLSILNRQLSKLSEQVKSILSSCEVDAGSSNSSVEKIEIDLYQAVKSVADQMMVAHPEAKIGVNIAPDTTIEANPALFDEIVNNLVQNAIRYSDKAPDIIISYDVEKGGKEKLSFKDNGKGIPSDKLDSIFDKFFKVEKLSSTTGYGLGLHFVKQTVEQHGWDIDVDSTVGEGSVFTITLNPDSK